MRKEIDNPYRTLMYTKEMYEYYAMEILKRWDSERYTELSHIGSNKSPDLQTPSCSIGVEVTRANIERVMRVNNFYAEYSGAWLRDIPQRVIGELYDSGWIFGNNNGRADVLYQIYDKDITDEEQIAKCKKCIQNKTEMVNTCRSYCECNEYELFVFLQKPLRYNAIESIYKSIPSIYQGHDKIFTCIHILSGNLLYVCKEKSLLTYGIEEIKNSAWRSAYTNSGMEAKSLALLKQQGHI